MNQFHRQLAGWGTAAAVVTLLPAMVYVWYWPVSVVLEPDAFVLLSGFAAMGVAWLGRRTVSPDLEAYVVGWFGVPIAVYLLTAWVWSVAVSIPAFVEGYPFGLHAFAVAFAAIGGYALDHATEQLLEAFPGAIGPIARHKLIVGAIILLGVTSLVGLSVATPADTTIEEAEPAFFGLSADTDINDNRLDHPYIFSFDQYAMAVLLDIDPAIQRVVVETPSGETFDQVLSRDVPETDQGVVVVQANPYGEGAYELGIYTIRIESAWGQTLDETTVEITEPANVTAAVTEVREENGTLVDIELAYTGDFPTYFQLTSPTVEVEGSNATLVVDDTFSGLVTDSETVTTSLRSVDEDGEPVQLDPGTYTLTVTLDPVPDIDPFETTITVNVSA